MQKEDKINYIVCEYLSSRNNKIKKIKKFLDYKKWIQNYLK